MRASPTQESANSLYPSPLTPPQNSCLEASSTDTPWGVVPVSDILLWLISLGLCFRP